MADRLQLIRLRMRKKTETKAFSNWEHYKNFKHATSPISIVLDNLGVWVRRKHTSYIKSVSYLLSSAVIERLDVPDLKWRDRWHWILAHIASLSLLILTYRTPPVWLAFQYRYLLSNQLALHKCVSKRKVLYKWIRYLARCSNRLNWN